MLGRQIDPRLLQIVAERGRGPRHLLGHRVGIGDEVPRRQPQAVHAAINVFGQIAHSLQPLQFREGPVDMTKRDNAGRAGDHDDRQHQQKTAESQLTDRNRG